MDTSIPFARSCYAPYNYHRSEPNTWLSEQITALSHVERRLAEELRADRQWAAIFEFEASREATFG